MVDLELYRIFKVVAEEENITHASEKLNISQPAVTKHIQNLEEILNIKLFERTNKGLILTKIGKDIYDEIREPIGILENLYKKYSDSRDINLGIHTTMLNKLFSKKLSKYYELNENAKINIVNYDVEDMLFKLLKQELDIVITKKISSYENENIEFIKTFIPIPQLIAANAVKYWPKQLRNLVFRSNWLLPESLSVYFPG